MARKGSTRKDHSMKKIQKMLVVQAMSAICFIGCGSSSTTPGSGPPFSSISPALTAKDLYLAVSKSTCGTTHTNTSGDTTCAGGGTIHKEETDSSSADSSNCTYSKCVAQYPIIDASVQGLQLEANGESSNQDVKKGGSTTAESLNQHMSFSGDLGFAADCDVQISTLSSSASLSGSCVYRDSAGEELTITAGEILDLLSGGFS